MDDDLEHAGISVILFARFLLISSGPIKCQETPHGATRRHTAPDAAISCKPLGEEIVTWSAGFQDCYVVYDDLEDMDFIPPLGFDGLLQDTDMGVYLYI